ncbi:MAG TPA: tripartite tricarboxylate transporter substrate binding protein [Burkholderiales bacterium]|nr:tripartite tricarboxylate transporter substrate binding protein [Burkholderiales bacterium]
MKTLLIAVMAAIALQAGNAQAQTYPAKPIRVMVPFPPGGSTDIVARIVAQKLSAQLGQQMVIENRGGAGGTLGTAVVAKAPADGYTLVVGTTSTHVVAPSVYTKLEYDPVKDFAPVSLIAVTPYLLVVNPSLPAKSLSELVELLRAQPGKLNYASAGVGSTTHLAMEMLKSASNTYALHIPYNGNGPAGTAVISGQVEILFGSMPAVLPHVRSGRVRALAVGTPKRSPSLPEVPTVAESGYPGFDASLWLAIMAPAGTPASIIERLHTETLAAVGSAETKGALDKAGAEAITSTPAELSAMIRDGVAKYSKVVKAAGVKPE